MEKTDEKFAFNEGVERKLLKAIIVNRKFLASIVDLVRSEYFVNEVARDIYKITKSHFIKYKDSIDINVLYSEVKNIYSEKNIEVQNVYRKYFAGLIKEDVRNSDAEYLYDQCLSFCKRQAYKAAFLNNVKFIDNNDFSTIDSAFKKASLIGCYSENEIDYFKEVKSRIIGEKNDIIPIQTGIVGLDKIVYGGWNYKTHPLILFMAPSGVGKSIALCYTGSFALKQNKVVFHYTFELSPSMTAARYDAAITSININERHDQIDEVEKRIGVLKATNTNSELFIKEYSTGTCTSNMLRADIEKKIGLGFKPDLIIIDYLDIMRFETSKSDDSYFTQQKISEELRAIGQDYHVCVISATQTNREGVNSTTEIESDKVADSYGKIKTSDLIISINQTKAELLQNKARLYIAKNRTGLNKKIIPITIKYDTMTLRDRSNAEIVDEILNVE